MSESYKHRLKNIKAFVFDIDGVLTDGQMFYSQMGEYRSLYSKDAFAMGYALEMGYKVCLISRANTFFIKKLVDDLKGMDVFLSVHNKDETLRTYLQNNKLSYEQVLYMGDDLPDYHCIKKASIGTCPKDAVHQILQASDYVSIYDGGKGAVREVIEQVLRMQDKWLIFE